MSRVFVCPCTCSSPKPTDGIFIHDPENGEDSNVALEKLRDVIAQCILPQAGKHKQTHRHTDTQTNSDRKPDMIFTIFMDQLG